MKAGHENIDLEFFVEEVLLRFSNGRLSLIEAVDSLLILFWKYFNLSKGGKILDYLENGLGGLIGFPGLSHLESGPRIISQ